MAFARFIFTLMAFFYGVALVALPTLRLGILLLAISGYILRPRVRVIFVIALACGMLDAAWRINEPTQNFGPIFNQRAIVVEQHETDNGTILGLALDAGPHLEAWIPPVKTALLGHALRLGGVVTAFDEARNPGSASERALAAQRGVTGRLTHAVINRDEGLTSRDVRTWLPLARARCFAILGRYLDPPSATLVAAVLWGAHDVRPEFRQAFVATGTVHVLIPAGLHVGMMVAIALAVLRGARFGRSSAAIMCIPLILLYVGFAEAHLPAVRAAVGAAACLLARAFGAQSNGWRTYMLAISAIVVFDPFAPASLSFWLSFCCVGTILALQPTLENGLRWLPRWLRQALALTLAAQIGTWPLIALALHTVSITAPLANMLVVPMVCFLLGSGTLVVMLGAYDVAGAHILANIIAPGCTLLAHAILTVVVTLATLPGAKYAIPEPAVTSIVVYYVGLVLASWLLQNQSFATFLCIRRRILIPPRRLAYLLLLGIQATPAISLVGASLPGELYVTMLDVGQGDGIVVETPHHHVIVIDTGGRLEIGARNELVSPAEKAGAAVLLPFLAHEGVRAIDLLVLTHPHGDHVGGAAPIMTTMPVGMLLDSGQSYPGRAYLDALDQGRRSGVPLHVAERGEVFTTDDGVQLSVLAPFSQALPTLHNAVNEGSIILRLRYRGWSMLFTGDAGAPTEARLLAAGDDLRSNVLKVGHHGSAGASSMEFVKAVAPELAVISVGRANFFGHPAAQTLTTLELAGSTVLRTDRCGAITLTPHFNQDNLATTFFRTMLPCGG